MRRLILRRLIASVIALWLCSVISFALVRLAPGDPARAMLMNTGGATSEQVVRLRAQLGLNRPLLEDYANYMSHLLRGDLGRSLVSDQPVTTLIRDSLTSTVTLAAAALCGGIVLALIIGLGGGLAERSWSRVLWMIIPTLGFAIPTFWLGSMAILVFGVKLGWVPITAGSDVDRLALPALVLAIPTGAILGQLLQSGVLEVLEEDYIRTARAKGATDARIVIRHVLPNAAVPAITMFGMIAGGLLSGTIVIEAVFARQGLGSLLVNAVTARDLRVIQGCVMLIAVVYIAINFVVDVIQYRLNPRLLDALNSS